MLSFLIMRFSTAVATAAFIVACSAAPASGKYNLHEKRDGRPHAWQKRHRAVADQVLPIRIALRQRNVENAESYIYDVADPSSPNFGKPALVRALCEQWPRGPDGEAGSAQACSYLQNTLLTEMPNRQALVGGKGCKHLCSAR